MTKRQNRMILVALLVLGVSLASYFGIKAFNENLLYFFTPTDVLEGKAPQGKSFRIGGLVQPGSVIRDDLLVFFTLTDNNKTIEVRFEGILPDLFREGQGIVATGSVSDGNIFRATEVLAKHDETYMPPEVAEALQNYSSRDEVSKIVEVVIDVGLLQNSSSNNEIVNARDIADKHIQAGKDSRADSRFWQYIYAKTTQK